MSDAATLTPPPTTKKRRPPAAAATAETMATKQREISVSEFFAKNRHLLGFDNPRKALLTTVKEAVDNALDACEEAGILPDLLVQIELVGGGPALRAGSGGGAATADATRSDGSAKDPARSAGPPGDERFRVTVRDNGPGIVRRQIENVFGRLLYGSKFHRLKMSRGQQGIGISAAGMYGLITTGKPVLIISKTAKNKPAHEVVLKMDTSKNKADVVSETEHPEDDHLFQHGHGTQVTIELQGKYFKGARSVDEYVQLTAIANPHARIEYRTPPTSAFPDGEAIVYERSVEELPPQTEEIKPHPHGIELGTLIGMLERTECRLLGAFFKEEFCRIGPGVAAQICESAGLHTGAKVKDVRQEQAEKLYRALQDAKVMAPPTSCVAPIGVKTILKGLERGLKPDFIVAVSRDPAVYRGRPFIIEAGIAYGGNLPAEDAAQVYRFANRVPLQYQQSACASFKAALETNWKNYGLEQPKGSMPVGPLVILIHMASVWVPFTSESKEAIADYDEIREEMALALKECGRKLKAFLNKRKSMSLARERRSVLLRYIGEIAKSCEAITGTPAPKVYDALMKTAQKKTAEMDMVLDEEGRVVKDAESLDDGSVFIREAAASEAGASRAVRSAADGDPLPRLSAAAAPPRPLLQGEGPAEGASRRTKPKTPPSPPPAADEPAQPTLFGEAPTPAPAPTPAGTPVKKKIIRKILVKKIRRKKP